jgi:hypothetical protein
MRGFEGIAAGEVLKVDGVEATSTTDSSHN